MIPLDIKKRVVNDFNRRYILYNIEKSLRERPRIWRLTIKETETLGHSELVFYIFYLCYITDIDNPEFYFNFYDNYGEEEALREKAFKTCLYILSNLYDEETFNDILNRLFKVKSLKDIGVDDTYKNTAYFDILTNMVFQRVYDLQSPIKDVWIKLVNNL